MSRSPEVIFNKITRGQGTIGDFDDLCRESALYYNKFGSGDQIKLAIPKGTWEGKAFMCSWNPERAIRAKDEVIRMFAKLGLSDSVCVDEDDNGYWIVFTTNSGAMLGASDYKAIVESIHESTTENNIKISKKEIVRDLPYEHLASWYNRHQVIEETTAYLHSKGYEDFTRGIISCEKNWNPDDFSDYINGYVAKGRFVDIDRKIDSNEDKFRKVKEFVDLIKSEV